MWPPLELLENYPVLVVHKWSKTTWKSTGVAAFQQDLLYKKSHRLDLAFPDSGRQYRTDVNFLVPTFVP